MDKEGVKQKHQHNPHNVSNGNNRTTWRERQIIGEGLMEAPQSADLVLRWGNRKRLRCMKIQVKDSPTSSSHRTATVRRVIRSDTVIINNNSNNNNNGVGNYQGGCNGHFNLRQRSASPARPPLRSLRNNNTESGSGMKGHQGNGVRGVVVSPERGSGAHENNNNNNGVRVTSSSDKGGSSSGGSDVVVWPPKFMIALTNKEKEEDFMAIKGSKLPQRPKKRAKFVQRTLNLVSPGGWLCDLTLERYEVREKKTSKKRPRGLKAMGNYIDSESE